AVMLSLCRALTARLRDGDPLQARVKLIRSDFVRALLPGLKAMAGGSVAIPSDETLVAEAVSRAGSSFTNGMRILPAERKRGMFALYGFCRAVDDIADAPAPIEEKRIELAAWASELD